MSVFSLLTNSMSVNGQVYDIANWHAGFRKHFICKETLSCGDSPTCDQDIRRIKYTCSANFTKLCRHHQETSTTTHLLLITKVAMMVLDSRLCIPNLRNLSVHLCSFLLLVAWEFKYICSPSIHCKW